MQYDDGGSDWLSISSMSTPGADACPVHGSSARRNRLVGAVADLEGDRGGTRNGVHPFQEHSSL